mmetsp:Transcript_4476/g.7826  ORF Transcript_4476/g.7826 Transcript_4476/m.7826 type:complete len:228 (-) Transcript_4476:105-788(-)
MTHKKTSSQLFQVDSQIPNAFNQEFGTVSASFFKSKGSLSKLSRIKAEHWHNFVSVLHRFMKGSVVMDAKVVTEPNEDRSTLSSLRAITSVGCRNSFRHQLLNFGRFFGNQGTRNEGTSIEADNLNALSHCGQSSVGARPISRSLRQRSWNEASDGHYVPGSRIVKYGAGWKHVSQKAGHPNAARENGISMKIQRLFQIKLLEPNRIKATVFPDVSAIHIGSLNPRR